MTTMGQSSQTFVPSDQLPSVSAPKPDVDGKDSPAHRSDGPGQRESSGTLVAWLQHGNRNHAEVTSLSQIFRNEGLVVKIIPMDELCQDQIKECDLILVESFGFIDTESIAIVELVRRSSRAPMVMLTSSNSRNQMIDALAAGADAVWALGMPREMLLARCKALLRRWL